MFLVSRAKVFHDGMLLLRSELFYQHLLDSSLPALLILPHSVTKIPMCYVANIFLSSENTSPPKYFPESDLFYQHLLDSSLPAAHIAFTVTK